MVCSPRDHLEFLKSRRSIRRFKPARVPSEVLMEILDVARFAPSAHNSQPWRYIIIDDPSIKERLASIHGGAKPLRSAPQAIVVVVNRDESPDSYLIDGANTTLYIQLAAHAVGLGTVWIQTMGYEEKIREILGLPENYTPVAILAIGYPDEKPEPPERKSLEEIVFRNRYGGKSL